MSLREWYADRELLLTGVTSELGRALLEKILRSFPGVKVYAVLRSRNHCSKEERIRKIFSSPGYERLRQDEPNAISRVEALEGNLVCDGLGLGEEERAALTNVSVAFHAAGPHEALFEFCQELPRLRAISAATSVFRYKAQITESVQNEHIPDIPLALLRVPVLGPANREPMPGFVEILKGPAALMVGAGFTYGRAQMRAELLPVDVAANNLIVIAWARATRSKTDRAMVYNAPTLECTWGELIEKGNRANRKFAYPTFGVRGMTSIALLHRAVVLLCEWLPSILCDTAMFVCGGKRRMLDEYVKVRKALRSLEPVLSRSWPIERNRLRELEGQLTPEDREAFSMCVDIDVETYVLCAAAASKKYCANESNFKIVRNFTWGSLIFVAVALFLVFFIK